MLLELAADGDLSPTLPTTWHMVRNITEHTAIDMLTI